MIVHNDDWLVPGARRVSLVCMCGVCSLVRMLAWGSRVGARQLDCLDMHFILECTGVIGRLLISPEIRWFDHLFNSLIICWSFDRYLLCHQGMECGIPIRLAFD